ncbi:MAG: alpha/beta hydrolase, partial [Actinobacteria bacterium]|nr:alpha/beta hydrolase [Actinomycetota bacterium]
PALSLVEDAVHGLGLYRANVRFQLRPEAPARVRVPVQLVLARQDRYVTPPMARAALRWTDSCWLREIDTGHWGAVRTCGDKLARWVIDLAEHVAGGRPDAGLVAARAAADRLSSA